MGGADETIVLDLDASGVERGAARAKAAMGSIGDGATAAAGAATSGLRPVADVVKQLNRAANAASGGIGAMGEALEAAANGAQRGKLALIATATAAGLALAATVKFGRAVIDTARNIDDLSEALTDADRARLKPYIASLEEANRALSRFDESTTALQINLSSLFGPALTDAVDGVSGLIAASDRLVTWLRSDIAPEGSLGDMLLRLTGTGSALSALSAFGDLGRKLQGPADAQGATFNAAALNAQFGGTSQGAQGGQRKSDGLPASQARDEFAGAVLDASQLIVEGMRADADEQAKIEADAIARRQAQFASYVDWMHEQRQRDIEDARAAAEQETQLQADALQERQQVTTAAFGAVDSILGELSKINQDRLRNETNVTREERMKQFRAQQAISYAQAIVGAAEAIIQGYAQLGPIGGSIAALATATVTGLEIATIASTEPTFHVGGTFAPDERFTFARTRDNELGAFFTAQALDRIGGPQVAQDLAQTGRGGRGGGNTYLILNGEQFVARQFAKPHPSLGQRS